MATPNEQMLVPLVDAAVKDVTALDDVKVRLALQGQGQAEDVPASFRELLAYIDAAAELEIFRGGAYFLGHAGGTATPASVLRYLLRRASTESPTAAVAHLKRYMEATELPCIRRTIVTGVSGASSFQLDENTHFVPWGQIPDDGDKILQEEGERMFSSYGFSHPSGIIDAHILLPKRHVEAGAPVPEVELPDALTDARAPVMALQLVCPNGVFGPITWHHFPSWCFGAPTGMRYFQPLPERTGHHQLTDEDIAQAQALQEKLAALTSTQLEPLWLMAHRLSLAQSHAQPVENAIDLRIAYEMTFFFGDESTYQGELKFRLALHAARLLGKTSERREEIREIGNDVYDLSSGAIHAGRIRQKFEKNAHELLRKGAHIAREGIKHIVLSGTPDWKRLLLE